MKRPSLLRARARALSLIEVIVAASLLALGSLSTMAVMSSAISAGAQTRKTSKVALLMDALLERYRAVGEAKLRDGHLDTPATEFREFALASGSTEGAFTIVGRVGGGVSELNGVTVTTTIMTEAEAGGDAENVGAFDLNGDGVADDMNFDGDASTTNIADYTLVPLMIVVEYDGVELVESVELVRCYTIVYPTTTD